MCSNTKFACIQGWLRRGVALHGLGKLGAALRALTHGSTMSPSPTLRSQLESAIVGLAVTEEGRKLLRLKLMTVGAGRSGKTTLLASILNKAFNERGTESTKGIDSMTCELLGATAAGQPSGHWTQVNQSLDHSRQHSISSSPEEI